MKPVIRIHHNTVKKAAKYGVHFMELNDGSVCAVHNHIRLCAAKTAALALEMAIGMIEPGKTTAQVNGAPAAPAPQSSVAPTSPRPKHTAKPAAKSPVKPVSKSAAKPAQELQDPFATPARTKSIIKPEYVAKYRANGMTCGDAVSLGLARAFGGAKKGEFDWGAFVAFAKANGAWNDRYLSLNNGSMKMTVSNNLRQKLKRGEVIKWP